MVAVMVQQLEAAAPVVVLVVAAVAASWRLVEGKMYFLPALAARTSVDRNRGFILQERKDGMGGGGGGQKINNTFTRNIRKGHQCQVL